MSELADWVLYREIGRRRQAKRIANLAFVIVWADAA
jgi:hypothetical protein